jgi:hypothetical protein
VWIALWWVLAALIWMELSAPLHAWLLARGHARPRLAGRHAGGRFARWLGLLE